MVMQGWKKSNLKNQVEVLKRLENIMSTLERENLETTEFVKEINEKLEICKEEIIRRGDKKNTNRDNTNISAQLWDLAGRETAEYVEKHMVKCATSPNPNALREKAVSQVELEGMYLEFGVYSGKSINQIASLKENQILYGFDSFEGLPETWRTGFYKGKFETEGLPKVQENVQLIKGWFDSTLPVFLKEHKEKVAFLHVDCDLYSSTKCVFDCLKDRIVSGTIIVFDEYFNYPSWKEHEYRAFQEFVRDNNIQYEYLTYVPNWEQVAVRII